ncbi:S-type anion channel slah1 [Turnera subulata]|uniref:S-type anion channel slah1 n=1 Tax=Turnera subulata TaxID=218843 RepID=A0A9Q0FYM4_9ROSI|nr:S-type anion channel slah1 [Turnera subulata]
MACADIKPSVHIIVDAPSSLDTSQGPQNSSQPIAAKPSQSSILTRIHAGYFRITVSFAGQALLWKILSESRNESMQTQAVWHVFHRVHSSTFLLLWWVSLAALVSLSLLYALKCVFHFSMVKEEFLHHIGVNYLYAPWISWLLLLQSCPIFASGTVPYLVLCCIFSVPVVVLDIKLYGQWFTTEKRFLSTLANPTSQISVIGNLVVARAAAEMGWKESAVCMFSLGMVHYLVLFVTLYQRLSGGNSFPSLLRPAFFLFFAAPSMASLAWNSISGAFDTSSKMLFFLSLFLFMSLVCRPALFKKSMRKFNVAWWAYSFTLTFLALVSAEYAKEVKGRPASLLMLVLSVLSTLVFLGLMLLTGLNTDGFLPETDPVLNFSNHSKTRT